MWLHGIPIADVQCLCIDSCDLMCNVLVESNMEVSMSGMPLSSAISKWEETTCPNKVSNEGHNKLGYTSARTLKIHHYLKETNTVKQVMLSYFTFRRKVL